jgi:hypothetical protein
MRKQLSIILMTMCSIVLVSVPLLAGDFLSGTYLDPALQRKDLLSHRLTNAIPEYRQVYNRPRYMTGFITSKIEPSSQEAMAWRTNYCNGNYANHRGPSVPYYYYPKPWEALDTKPRPDALKSNEPTTGR